MTTFLLMVFVVFTVMTLAAELPRIVRRHRNRRAVRQEIAAWERESLRGVGMSGARATVAPSARSIDRAPNP